MNRGLVLGSDMSILTHALCCWFLKTSGRGFLKPRFKVFFRTSLSSDMSILTHAPCRWFLKTSGRGFLKPRFEGVFSNKLEFGYEYPHARVRSDIISILTHAPCRWF